MRFLVLLFSLMTLHACSDYRGTPDTALSETPKTSFMGMHSEFVQINGLRFHYVQQGHSGDVVVFLHGFPYFGESWYKLMRAFSQSHQTFAPDNRGYGLTEKPKRVEDYRIELLVADVVAFLKAVSPAGKVILVGHDWGAAVASATAQVQPELIDQLILINGAPYNAFLQVLQKSELQRERSKYVDDLDGWLARLLFKLRGSKLFWRGQARLYEAGHVDDNFKQAYLNAWDQPGAAQAAVNWYVANIPKFDEIADKDFWPNKSAKISIPTLLIWSKDDPAFTIDTFNAIPDFIDDLTIHIIESKSHAPFLDHSEEVIRTMRKFVDIPKSLNQ